MWHVITHILTVLLPLKLNETSQIKLISVVDEALTTDQTLTQSHMHVYFWISLFNCVVVSTEKVWYKSGPHSVFVILMCFSGLSQWKAAVTVANASSVWQ